MKLNLCLYIDVCVSMWNTISLYVICSNMYVCMHVCMCAASPFKRLGGALLGEGVSAAVSVSAYPAGSR